MRHLVAVLAVTTGVAHADSAWSEYGPGQPLQRSSQLVEATCDMTIELRGAIAEVTVQQRLANPGPATLAALTELELPVGAQLIGVTLQRGRGKTEVAIPVNEPVTTERVSSDRVLGADPAIVTALPARAGRPRFRVIFQPLEAEQDLVLGTRWTALAELRDGALQLALPGRDDGVTPPCKGLVHAAAGPGTSIERIRIGNAEAGARGTATFELGATDTTISAVLAFKRARPVVWSQLAPLGDGWFAHAITIATPAVRDAAARRVVLVIDDSRSMQLIGRHNVQRVVRAIATALPAGSELESIVFDRTASRVLGSWKPATAEHAAAIEAALAKRTAANGSDPAAALALARKVLADARGPASVILVTDGVLGDVDATTLTAALGGSPADVDLHTIALTPGRMRSPDREVLRSAVAHFGGSHVEVAIDELDTALARVDDWIHPAWLGIALAGSEAELPAHLLAGHGIVVTSLSRRPGKPTLTAYADARISIAAAPGPAAPLAQLALAAPPDGIPAESLALLRTRHPAVDATRAFVVLSSAGRVAANRRAMILGGGPYTRIVDVDDPRLPPEGRISTAIPQGGSAIDRNTIQLLLRTHLQPAAFACYQRALATNAKLTGTAHFKLELARGELTRAWVDGVGDSAFDTCLLDAAYAVTPPLPNPDYNTDDRTLVNYPLSFSVREHKPFVLAGDADSSSPLDIDAIQGGPPTARRPIKVNASDTSTPLGGLRPPPAP